MTINKTTKIDHQLILNKTANNMKHQRKPLIFDNNIWPVTIISQNEGRGNEF